MEYLGLPGTKANWKAIKGEILACSPDWLPEAPYQIKSIAIRDACIAVQNAKRKHKVAKQLQRIGWKSLKNPVQSCYIPKASVTAGGLYPRLTGSIHWSEDIPEEFGDCRLIFENGRWFVSVPHEVPLPKSENQGRVVGLDPGVRTFLAFFGEDACGKLGEHSFGRIQRLCEHLDDLISRSTDAKAARRHRMRKAMARLRWKVKDLVNEMHHKIARFLVENFDVILLPTFETQQMSRRSTRKIGHKSVRSMLTWAHYRFKQFLKFKAAEFGKLVLDVNEAWTSKTVSWTGEIQAGLGGAKSIRSHVTGDEMDRDINGARGVFLRALGDHPWLKASIVARVASGNEK